jgi:hypothetical protein
MFAPLTSDTSPKGVGMASVAALQPRDRPPHQETAIQQL